MHRERDEMSAQAIIVRVMITLMTVMMMTKGNTDIKPKRVKLHLFLN